MKSNPWKEAEERWAATPWSVGFRVEGDSLYVYPERLWETGDGVVIVRPPNIIERLLGISFEEKIHRAIAKVRKRVDSLEEQRISNNQWRAAIDQILKELRS